MRSSSPVVAVVTVRRPRFFSPPREGRVGSGVFGIESGRRSIPGRRSSAGSPARSAPRCLEAPRTAAGDAAPLLRLCVSSPPRAGGGRLRRACGFRPPRAQPVRGLGVRPALWRRSRLGGDPPPRASGNRPARGRVLPAPRRSGCAERRRSPSGVRPELPAPARPRAAERGRRAWLSAAAGQLVRPRVQGLLAGFSPGPVRRFTFSTTTALERPCEKL